MMRTYEFKKFETYKPTFMHEKSLKIALCQEDWPKSEGLTVSKQCHVHKV